METPSQNQTDKTFDEKIIIMQEAVKQVGNLFLNNILCSIHKDFRKTCHGKDDYNDIIAIHTSNVFLDFILDRLAVLKLCSSSTGDMTIHECDNLNRILNRTEDGNNEDANDSED